MSPLDLDLFRIGLRRDLALAEHAAQSARWRGPETAALATLGLGYLGLFSRTLSFEALVALLSLACVVLVFANRALQENTATLKARIVALDEECERLNRDRRRPQ